MKISSITQTRDKLYLNGVLMPPTPSGTCRNVVISNNVLCCDGYKWDDKKKEWKPTLSTYFKDILRRKKDK